MEEGLIKSVSEGNKTLEHLRFRSTFNILQDSFDLIITSENGFKTHYPLHPPPKVTNFTKETDIISGMVIDYTEEEMLEVLRNNP